MGNYEIPDSMPKWMADHVRLYLDSGGRDGHMWDSSAMGGPGLLPTLLLTTTGRRSSKQILAPLLYGKADAGYVIIASKGGAPAHPAWYLNLTAQPEVSVQVGEDQFRARARTVSSDERDAL